jgi:hypothetical protein
MTDMHAVSTTLDSDHHPAAPLPLEEAARYAMLRRLAPAIRHHMVGEFQPIGMIASMMDRRLQAAEPNLSTVRDNCASLTTLSRSAAMTCMDLMTWIAPRSDDAITVEAGVAECLSLLSTELRFKGVVVVNEIPESGELVRKAAIRNVLSAAMIATGDSLHSPADMALSAQTLPGGVQICIDLRPAERVHEGEPSSEYRALSWQDLELLAAAESVRVTRADGQTRLLFPYAPSP